jgi:hypothetical protein
VTPAAARVRLRRGEDAYETYRPGGVPTLVPSAVLFLDILGTATFRDDDEAQAYLRQTHDAFARAREQGDSRRGASEITVATWFSDNLVMGMPLAGLLEPGHVVDYLALYAAYHQLVLGQAGLFARGAITFGLFYADEEFVNGPALNEAYKLESEAANYPRIIFSPSAMQALSEAKDRDGLDAQICAGDDAVPFVDYLRYIPYMTPEQGIGDDLAMHRGQIREHLKRYQDNVRIEQKYAWLASYHDARAPSDPRVSEDSAPHFKMLDPSMK